MANSLGSTDGSAAKIEPGLVEATVEAPSEGKLQSSEESGGCTPGDTADAFDDSGNNGKHFPGQEDTRLGVVQEPGAHDTDFPNKPKMGDPEIEEQTTAKIQEEEQVQCSEKCALKNPMIDDAAFIEGSLLANGKCDGDGNGTERNRKREETKEKKEKKPKRRGGRARKNKDILNFTSNEKNENRLQYSRKEMEALRFQELEDQKKKWVEVYCGLGQQVAQEYDGLVDLAKLHQKHGVPSVDFDPRPQFLKSANLGAFLGASVPEKIHHFVIMLFHKLDCECMMEVCEDRLKFADNQAENLNTLDPASASPITDEIDCSLMEGEYSQDDDSDEDYSSIQKPAFFVKGEPDFDSGPPQDGLEYLRRVRWEAARIPKVTVAKVNIIKEQSSYMPQVPDIMMCPVHLLPLKQWEDSFLDDFSELRLRVTMRASRR
ncbi:UNVERIFIED_CONTAM: hypothetical protein Sradi_4571300 [Sesamum radiatum]|uniref:Uncharacterized protein n=1 Tax=Sesamum radiatum TaxID=300843 RepID=A0AAW2N9W1_SESRA